MATSCDIVVSGDACDYQEFSGSIKQKVALKGFCTLSDALQKEALTEILSEIDTLRGNDRFYRPHDILQSGLLGEAGSSRLARLSDQPQAHEGPALDSLIRRIDAMGFSLKPSSAELGFEVQGRTPVFLHESSKIDASVSAFTEADALEWLDWYTWTRVFVIFFLGPSSGSLILSLDDEDSLPYRVAVEPGTCVILRSDRLQYTFEPNSQGEGDRCYAAGAWFLERAQKHAWLSTKGMNTAGSYLECYQDLEKWLTARLETASGKRDKERNETPEYLSPMSRSLEMAMKSFQHSESAQNLQTAILGASYDLPQMTAECYNHQLFSMMAMGADLTVQVPDYRPQEGWIHMMIYDPNAGPGDAKIYSKHGCFVKTWELFDNKFFGISGAEAATMSAVSKKGLENAYAAMHDAGETKKSLQKSQTGTFFASTTHEEFHHTEYQVGFGHDNSITCGRIGFCLNLMGPMMTVESDGSSALLAAKLGVTTLHVEKEMNSQAVVCAGYHSQNPMQWKYACTNGLLSRTGPCLSFDTSANGFGKSEGTGAIFLKAMADVVDGQGQESSDVKGIISSAVVCSDGSKASVFGAPNGVVVQSMFHDVTYGAGLIPLDVDAVELHASGIFMEDAVEAVSALKCFGGDATDRLITLGSGKTNMMYAKETAGMAQIFKLMQSLDYGVHLPNVHLRTLNECIDFSDAASAIFQTESMPLKRGIANAIAYSHGIGGGNAAMLFSSVPGKHKPEKQETEYDWQLAVEAPLLFWPGGTRELEDEAVVAARGYTIIGSWSNWSKSEEMRWEGSGIYGCTVTLGENRYEHFQIFLDGDPEKSLHPNVDHAPNGSGALFASIHDAYENDYDLEGTESGTFTWQLDGRDRVIEKTDPDSGELVSFCLVDPSTGQPFSRQDEGKLGDQYHIRLYVAGKHRMVEWQKLASKPLAKSEDSILPSTAKYYIVADWDDWGFQEMLSKEASPGAFYLDVVLKKDGGEFQIVREQDWHQVFWPSDVHGDVSGPSSSTMSEGNWQLDGAAGERFRIEFERKTVSGADTMKISWRKL